MLVFSPYFEPHIGGLEGYVRDLNAELVRLRLADTIMVLAPRLPPEGQATEQLDPGYRVVRYPAFELIPNFPCPAPWRKGFVRALRESLDPRDYDVVICHTRFFLSSLAALLYSKAVRRPLIHVEHGSDYVHLASRISGVLARGYDVTLGRLVLRHADAVVAISQAAGRFVAQLASCEVRVIYRGMDRTRYEGVRPSTELAAWAAGRPVAVFVGRLIDGKGVADLIEAFALLDDRRTLLCIVGDGPRRRDLEALSTARGLDDRCRFAGYRPEDEALSLMRACDVVVNPSYTEGLPTSVLEAALLRRSIIASMVGGTAEVVEDERSALLVSPGDVTALANALARVLGDEQLRLHLGSAAHAAVAQRFDPAVSARQFFQEVRRLVDAPGH